MVESPVLEPAAAWVLIPALPAADCDARRLDVVELGFCENGVGL